MTTLGASFLETASDSDVDLGVGKGELVNGLAEDSQLKTPTVRTAR